MSKNTLTKAEKELNRAIDAGEYQSAFSDKESQRYAQAAQATFQ